MKNLKTTALVASELGALVLSSTATAATYVGNWDPPFGAPFAADLGWRGTAAFFVPDSCVPAGSSVVSNFPTCGGAAAVTSATVQFYDTDVPGTTIATLAISSASMMVQTLYYVAGQLDQLDTSFSNSSAPSADLGSYGVTSTTRFALQFDQSGPRLHWETSTAAGSNDAANFPPQFTITPGVPEPSTYALLLAGLGVLTVVRRRRPR